MGLTRFLLLALILAVSSALMAADDKTAGGAGAASPAQQQAAESATGFGLGGVFGAVMIDGKNYQQIGLRPELRLWKLGIGLDINVLLDEEGKVRKEDWNTKEAYLDKIYYVRWSQKGDTFYFRYGGLESTTLGYGTLIYGYTNMLEYPTYKRQGLEVGIETTYFGIEAIAGNLKELSGQGKGVMGGGRVYIKPFSRLQIGGSMAADLNEFKGLRDTDGDGIPDEMDAYPEDDDYATQIEYYEGHNVLPATIADLIAKGMISPITRDKLMDVNKTRSRTSFWAADAGLRVLDFESFKFDIYAQFAQSNDTGGWGYTLPGARIKAWSFLEIYGDYRQQSDEFIFSYYNDTYDLERAKFVKNPVTGNYDVVTKKSRLAEAKESKGYLGGIRLNLFNLAFAKAEYQDMHWGDLEDKSIRGEISLKKSLIPMISKAQAYYVQNNVEKLEWRTESTVMSAVIGLGMGEGVSIDFKYLVTFEDKNGDGKIRGSDETITNVSVSTSTMF